MPTALPALLPLPRCLHREDGFLRQRPAALRIDPASQGLPALRSWCGELGLRPDPDPELGLHTAGCGTVPACVPPPRPGGYALRIAADGLAIRGHDARGLVWGLATLAQILAQRPRPPSLAIEDWPEYAIRYHHDDVSRRQVSTAADFRRIIRHLAAFKISHYTLYLEDMVLIDGLPGLGEGRGAFTPAALRALVAEGERWGIEVFPTLSLAGHQENLLRLPRYRGLGARTWQPPSSFDPRNPAVREHLSRVLDAVCPLFPSPWFHMGFDEVIGLESGDFAAHLDWCAGELARRGRTPLFWADMLYNHFGCELLERLHPAAVPVPWEYGPEGGRARSALPELLRRRGGAWILGGYGNWGTFLHAPLAEAQRQWRSWRRIADPGQVAAFGAAQWGDDGCENHRDLGWPLFAAFAEQAWSGDNGDEGTVETRFHTVFHRHPLPDLIRLRRLLEDGLAIPPGRAWRLHRLPAPGWVRAARAGRLPDPPLLDADARLLVRAGRLLARCRAQARRERRQLDHYGVAIDRLRAVNRRARAASRPAAIPAALDALAEARRSFRSAWLAHNRPEGLEVALAVFDRQEGSWRGLGRPVPAPACGWQALDLGRAWNACSQEVGGLPIGRAELAGTPFLFAGADRTHAEIAPGRTLGLHLPPVPLRDLHLLATQPRAGEAPRAGARLRLLRRGRVVYEEELLAIRHLCDWWAPLGEHLWAGGGLAHADPLRVRYALCPNPPYGITCISRFPWPAAPVVDRLELTCLAARPLQVFALTLEVAAR
jgi:hypothetical protein